MLNSMHVNFVRLLVLLITIPYLTALHAERSTLLKLTEAEQQWLDKNKQVKFTGDPNWLPFEAFDEDGQYIGIVAEHLQLISATSGIEFITIPNETWTESTEMAKQGLVDILSETDDSDLKSHLNFTSPYVSNPIVFAMRSTQNYVEGISAIRDMNIALIKDYGYASKIRRKYADIDFVTVDDIQDGLISVSTGKVDALLCTLALCSYTIADLNINNVRITGKTEFDTKLALGVQQNMPELLSILNKSIALITPEQQQPILDKWIKEKFAERTDYTLAIQILLVSLVLIGIFIFWNRRLSHEITLRKKTEKELAEHREQLEELVQQRTQSMKQARDDAQRANSAKTEFLSHMSHELRTPLNAILGFGQLLETSKNHLDDQQRDHINEILIAGRHLLMLINEVLDLSKVEAGVLELDINKIDISNVIEESVAMIQSDLIKNQVELIIQKCDGTYIVNADRMRLKQVLLNFLTNAIKYNCQQGKIMLHCSVIETGFLKVSVTDTGEGLTPEDIDKLFTPFERLDAAENIPGTGIGLVITKHLVEMMGGTIGVHSAPGNGTTFWFEVKLASVIPNDDDIADAG